MAKKIGYNTVLVATTDGATPTTSNKIGNIQSIDGPSAERPPVDCTTLDSTAREFLAGIVDGGEITMDLAWDTAGSTNQTWLINRFQNDNHLSCEIRINPGTTLAPKITFDALVTSFSPTFPLDDLIVASVGMKVTGAVTWPS